MAEPYEVDLTARAALALARDHSLVAGGILVAGVAPPLFAEATVRISLPGGRSALLAGRVVNHTPDGFFVHSDDARAVAALLALADDALAAPPDAPLEAEPPSPATGEDPAPAPDPDAADQPYVRPPPLANAALSTAVWDLIDLTSDVPLYKQVGDLSVNDKIRLARQANQPVRRILIRDVEKRIHLEILKNPQVQPEEVTEYCGMGGLSPAALEWVAGQAKYVKRKALVLKLVTNPATPTRIAKRLLESLSQRELLRVMRSPRTREAVSRTAKKKLMAQGVI